MEEKHKITRNRDIVTYMPIEDLRAYMADHQFTHVTFSEHVGISHTASVYYLNGYSPIPYGVVKLMYLMAFYGRITGPADVRLLKNLDRARREEPELEYLTPKELNKIIDAFDLDDHEIALHLGYLSARPVISWREGKTKMKFHDAKIIQYLIEIPEAGLLEVPGADDMLRLRKEGKAPIFVRRGKGEPIPAAKPKLPSFLE